MTDAELSGKNVVYWKTQLPVDYIDTSLTINTFENVNADLSGGKPAKLWFIVVEQTNNGATGETIELEITINGTAYTWTLNNIASGTPKYCCITKNLTTGDFTTDYSSSIFAVGNDPAGGETGLAIPFTAKSVGLIRVKQTSTVDGTSAQIEINIVWEKLVGV